MKKFKKSFQKFSNTRFVSIFLYLHSKFKQKKFSFPGSAACTVLAWGIIEFGDTYEKEGEMLNALRQIKWYADFIIKSSPEPGVVYGQVGDGVSDHGYMGRPENIDINQV